MKLIEVLKKYNKNKLNDLNFNLKYEIMTFIPIDQLMITIFKLNKSFFSTLKKRKIFNVILKNRKEIESEIFFNDENIEEILDYFKNTNEYKFILYQICAYFLYKKFNYLKAWKFNQFKIFKYFEILSFYLSHNKNIKEITFNSSGILKKEGKVKSLFEIFGKFKRIEILELINENLADDENDLFYISISLKNNLDLKVLNISQNSIGKNKTDLSYLTDILIASRFLNTLDLSSNNLFENTNEINAEVFFESLGLSENLICLNLSDNPIGEKNKYFSQFANAIAKNKSIKKLMMSLCKIGFSESNIYAVANMIEKKNLKYINLDENDLGQISLNDSMIFLIKIIENKKSLSTISLNENGINRNEITKKLIRNLSENIKVFLRESDSNSFITESDDGIFLSDNDFSIDDCF